VRCRGHVAMPGTLFALPDESARAGRDRQRTNPAGPLRVGIYLRNSAAWSVAHSRKVRGAVAVTSANVEVTNAG
jgi:hypothetical protein